MNMLTLLLICIIVVVCLIASRFSIKIGMPTLLIFIVLGMLFGSDGIFKIPFDNFSVANEICSFALIFIMFYGGFGTNWKMGKPVAVKAFLLSTVGVVMTAILTGLFCWLVLGFDILEGFLIGAVISSTDAASVFSILRTKKLNLKENTASLLELESGSNDPASYIMMILILTIMSGANIGKVFYLAFAQLVYGVAIGVAIAFAAIWVLKKFKFLTDGFDTIFVLAMAFIAYSLPSLIEGNGYLAVYVFGLILGNSKVKNKISLVHFFDGITGLAQIVIFFLLGLLASPSKLPMMILPALAIVAFMTFVSRPAAVYSLMSFGKSSNRQKLVVSWAGLRGASSIVFAIFATVNAEAMNKDIFHIVFCIALISVAVQGSLLPQVSKKLDMIDYSKSVLKTFNDYQSEAEMQLIKTTIAEGHLWVDKTVGELNLIAGMLIVLIKRNGESIIPKGKTKIHAGDEIVLSGEVYHEDGDVMLDEVAVDAKNKWANKLICELEIPENTLIIVIRRKNGKTIVPKGNTAINVGDTVVLCEGIKKIQSESVAVQIDGNVQ